MVYVSFCGGHQVASRACFYKEAKRWRQCLSFRRPCAHSVCTTCSKLQAALAQASEPCLIDSLKQQTSFQDFVAHAKIADRLLGHYCHQQRNREVYWLARQRAQTVGDLLCMTIDSYDRAKCMVPKFPHGGRSPKHPTYEKVPRALDFKLSLLHPAANEWIILFLRYGADIDLRHGPRLRHLHIPGRRGYENRCGLDD